MAKERKHAHSWDRELNCRCGEVHPIVRDLRALVEEQQKQLDVREAVRPPIEASTNGHYEPVAATAVLDADLQAIVDDKRSTPQVLAKMTRFAFAARGWPNVEHPGTVRDFLVEHNKPIKEEDAITTRG